MKRVLLLGLALATALARPAKAQHEVVFERLELSLSHEIVSQEYGHA